VRVSLRQYWNLLITYIKPQWFKALLLTVLLFSSIGLQLVNPQIVRQFIDTARAGGAAETLFKVALLFIGIAFVQQVVSVMAAYVGEDVGLTASNALCVDLADHCLHLDMVFHNTHTPGEMIERIDGDVTVLSGFFSQFVIQMLGNVLLLIGVLVSLFREGWQVGLVLTGFTAIALLVLWRLQNIALLHWTGARQASADLFGFVEERISGLEDICPNGAEAYVMRRFYRLMRVFMKKSLKAVSTSNGLVVTMYTFFTLGTAVAFAAGAYFFRTETVTIGTVYLIFQYATMLERPISHLIRQTEYLQHVGASIMRIQELCQIQSRIQDPDIGLLSTTAFSASTGALAVVFQDVSFCYDDTLPECGAVKDDGIGDKMVLYNLSFRLRSGTVLGLLGRTGSGKTTLGRLLFRLYDPDSGKILLGDGISHTDIRHVALNNLRRRIGIVTQNVQLFHATVRDNLAFFDRNVPDHRILQVIQDLGLGEWYQSLPEGLDAELGSSGRSLSAGEAQLLAFARIFIQDPGLVILDEASSRLDPATEYLIERAVDELAQNRTVIIIAHRLSTVQRADEIMILEDGRISEHGVRQELANDPTSRFYRLLQTGLEEALA
jgi:ABC-type multidrug transport system fused ATPase/permease subunit